MSASFHFTSLQPDCFRLLRILPGQFSSDLRCELSHHSIFSPPKYNALSYAWASSESPRKSIILNGHDFTISAELDVALRWLRQPETVRHMWIDAICIDQTNAAELNAQVATMSHIYRTAECVIAWLGEETNDSKRAMAFLREMAQEGDQQRRNTYIKTASYPNDDENGNVGIEGGDKAESLEITDENSTQEQELPPSQQVRSTKERKRKIHQDEHILIEIPCLYYDFDFKYHSFFTEQRQKDWEALDELLARPWWTRTWIVQEVWCSSNCLIQCGHSVLGWSTFRSAMEYQEGWDDMGYMVKNTSRWRYWSLLKRRYGLAIHLSQKRLFGGSLSSVLWNMWDREATDPRDKVFAVLGLVGTEIGETLLRADYSKTIQEVYKEAASYIIHQEQKLDILLAANGLERRSGLPSWVPDWRREANDNRPQLFINGSKSRMLLYFNGSTDIARIRGHGFYASRNSEVWAKTSSDSNILQVRGCILGIVRQVTSVCEASMATDDIVKKARSVLSSKMGNRDIVFSDHDLGDVCADSLEGQVHRRSDFSQVQHSSEPNKDISISDEELRNILRASFPETRDMPGRSEDELIRNIMHKRRFFVTTTNHLCVGPAATHPGDQIYIIAGCSFPMVLRAEGQSHGLVGEAYVHRNMSGEALESHNGAPSETKWDVVSIA